MPMAATPTAKRAVPPPAAYGRDQMIRYVNAQQELARLQATQHELLVSSDRPGSAALSLNRQQLKIQQDIISGIANPVKPKAAAAPVKPVVKPVAPPVPAVVAPPVSAVAAAPLPPAPVAVTDPASEISPEEQNARLRARILLMQGGRSGGLRSTMTSQLAFRSLIGLS
jgi:hypothetical protein